jgi:hypothetical protein
MADTKALWDNPYMPTWKRGLPLFKLRSIPGWFFLVWTADVLAQLHLAAFVRDGVERVSVSIEMFGEAHPVKLLLIGLAFGFGWLAICVWWPSIKAKILPHIHKPIQERVEDLERLVLPVARILRWQAQEEAGPHEFKRSVIAAVEVTALINEVAEVRSLFEDIKERFPESLVATQPFSNWRPFVNTTIAADSDIAAGLRWARALERHAHHISQWGERYKSPFSNEATVTLQAYVAAWKDHPGNPPVSKEKATQIMQMHEQAIFDKRHALMQPLDMAHALTAPQSPRSTTHAD